MFESVEFAPLSFVNMRHAMLVLHGIKSPTKDW